MPPHSSVAVENASAEARSLPSRGGANEDRDSPPEEAPVDIKALCTLRSLADEEGNLLVRLVDIFLADLAERLDTMRGALERNETEAVRRSAHAIKGSCGHFGAKRLAELCMAMEQHAQGEASSDESAALYHELAAESARVRRALEEQKALVLAGG